MNAPVTSPVNSIAGRLGLLALAGLVACGPGGGASGTLPTLPGDGDANVAKPRPGDKPADDPWAGRTDLIQAPEPPPPQEVKLPPIQRFTLKNGLQVIVVEDRSLPVVGMQLAIKAGAADDARPKRGVAEFAAAMLTKGARGMTAEQIAEAIDQVGGSLGASADQEATHAACDALSRDVSVCLKLLPAVVSAPTFPDKEMSEVRDQMITAVRQQRDDAQALAQVHFANELWGDANARGWPVTAATVQAITRDDLVAWHKTWFHPGNAVLAVAGDVDAKALQKQLEAAFRGWKPGKAPEHARHDEPAVQGIRVRLVDKPDQTQSQIVLGHLGIAHGDKDYYAVQIMNYGLGGGGFSSRLMKVVRSEGGKTYGARSGFDTYATRGAFAASTFTRSEETRSTIDLVLGEIAAMKAGGPSAEEISDAKANLAGRWVTGFESASDVAGTVLAAELHGFGDDYVREFALRAGAVTADEARRAAAARLDANNLVIVIVGAAKDVEPQLKQAGWPYEVISADAPIAKIDRAPAVAAPVTDAERKQALAIIDAALKAKGGEKKLAAVKSMVMEGTAEISFGPRSFPATLKRWWVLPDSLRYELTLQIPGLGDVPIVTVLDGTSGWGRRPDDQTGTIELSDMGPEEVTEARRQMWRDGDFILLRAKDEGTQLRPLASETIDGVEYDVVEVAAKGSSVKLYIDAKSRLLGRMAYLDGGEEALELFSSYKSVDGISVAHKRKTTASMGKLESTVTSVSFDEAVKDAVFAKPDK